MNKTFKDIDDVVKSVVNFKWSSYASHTDEEEQEQAKNCEEIFEVCNDYFNEHFHFPHPILVRTKSFNRTSNVKIKSPRQIRMTENAFFTSQECAAYYIDPSTGKEYFTTSELKDAFGYNFRIMHHSNSSTIYKYIKEIDLIIGFEFYIGQSASGLVLTSLYILNGENTTALKIAKDYNNFDLKFRSDSIYCCNYDLTNTISNRNYFHFSEIDSYQNNESWFKACFQMHKRLSYNTRGISYNAISHYSHYSSFLREKSKKIETTKKNSKAQAMIDKLVQTPLKNLSKYEILKVQKSYNNNLYWSNESNVGLIASFARVDKDTSVCRWTAINNFGYLQEDVIRIYCVKDKFFACKLTNDNQWVEFNYKTLAHQNFQACSFVRIDKSLVEGTSFAYYIDILKETQDNKRSTTLLAMIKEPVFERLAKIGLTNLVAQKTRSNRYIDTLDGFFIDKKEKNIYKAIGLNKYQVKRICDDITGEFVVDNFIQQLRWFFNTRFLSDIDNDTFDKAFNLFALTRKDTSATLYDSTLDWCKTRIRQVADELTEQNNPNLLKYFFSTIVPQLENVIRTSDNPQETIGFYVDYINMVSDMEAFASFKITFDFLNPDESIKTMHDEINALHQIKKQKIELEKFNQNIEKIKKYEYAPSKSEYVVIAPTAPIDVAKEGIELHHCVKSYIPRIANGNTNIMFIREKEDVDKPFFTVEVDNSGIIQQVHGFSNCNVNTVEGLREFVEEWSVKKKLKVGNITQVR